MQFAKGDTIVTAYAQHAAGPGWGNSPLWVIVRSSDGRLREECLQPEEQTREMQLFYNVASEVHCKMASFIEKQAKITKRKR